MIIHSTPSLSVYFIGKNLATLLIKRPTILISYFLNPSLSAISENGRVKNFKILFPEKHWKTGNWKLAESPFFELYNQSKSLQQPLDAFKYNETVKKNKVSFSWVASFVAF